MTRQDAMEVFRKALDALAYTERMSMLPTCNDCGYKDCPHRPGWGETVRYNCYDWRAKDD